MHNAAVSPFVRKSLCNLDHSPASSSEIPKLHPELAPHLQQEPALDLQREPTEDTKQSLCFLIERIDIPMPLCEHSLFPERLSAALQAMRRGMSSDCSQPDRQVVIFLIAVISCRISQAAAALEEESSEEEEPEKEEEEEVKSKLISSYEPIVVCRG